MFSFSVTFRPAVFDEATADSFKRALMGSVKLYLISEEKGASEDITHYQCFVEATGKATNNLRKKIAKEYEITRSENKGNPEDLTVVNLVIKAVKSGTEKYACGYCLKEGNDYDTNYTPEFLEDCKDVYNCQKAKAEEIKLKKKGKFGKNYVHIVESFIDYLMENEVQGNYLQIFNLFFNKLRKEGKASYEDWQKINKVSLTDYIECCLSTKNIDDISFTKI